MWMPMMGVRVVRMGVGQLTVVMDVRVRLNWRVARLGANADGARRASEYARESWLHDGAHGSGAP